MLVPNIDTAKILAAAEEALKKRRRSCHNQRRDIELDTPLIYVESTAKNEIVIVIRRLWRPLARSIERQLRDGIEALDVESIQVERTEFTDNIFRREYKWTLTGGKF